MFKQEQIRNGIKSRGRSGQNSDYIISNYDVVSKNISKIILSKIFKLHTSHI